MTRSKRKNGIPGPAEPQGASKKHRVEMSPKRMFLALCALILVLGWMFLLGVLAGRGLPLIDSEELSLRARLIRFIGLDKGPAPERANVAETWDSPRKMVESLTYYEDLAQKSPRAASNLESSAPLKTESMDPVKLVEARKAASQEPFAPGREVAKTAGDDRAALAKGSKTDKDVKGANKDTSSPEVPAEHFTLLIASLRDAESAQKLADQLKSRGYASRIEPLDLRESGRWNRVLVGSFQNREDALRFAADFNRKERLEGLVIRESH
ncbi:MAG: SPOR domain-containing protein [Syntrophobacteraceae bacterium]|nr:SPOR domain-containing protein [Syntrophobacteraceae bacterium]